METESKIAACYSKIKVTIYVQNKSLNANANVLIVTLTEAHFMYCLH